LAAFSRPFFLRRLQPDLCTSIAGMDLRVPKSFHVVVGKITGELSKVELPISYLTSGFGIRRRQNTCWLQVQAGVFIFNN
jgi:hypothetical protein